MNKPHKHTRVIKAWADGAEIECWDPDFPEWIDSPFPSWCSYLEYRVKPQPKKYKVDVWLTFKKEDGVFITYWSREPPSYIIPDEIVVHHTLSKENSPMCKFKVGDKAKTRDGADVEIVYIDERSEQPTMGVAFWQHSRIISATWHEDGSFVEGNPNNPLDLIPPSRTVTLYQAIVRTPEGRYFSPPDLFSGLDDDGIEDWNSGGYKVVRLLTEYPIEVEQ